MPSNGILGDFEQFRREGCPAQVANPVAQVGGRRDLEDQPLVGLEHKPDLRMADRLKLHLVLHMAQLGVFGAQKLPPRREIEKKRAHLDLGSGRFATVAHVLDLRPGDHDFGPCQRVVLPGGEPKRETLAMLGSASPRNPSVRMAARSVADADLARGVAFQAEQGVVAIHPARRRRPPG